MTFFYKKQTSLKNKSTLYRGQVVLQDHETKHQTPRETYIRKALQKQIPIPPQIQKGEKKIPLFGKPTEPPNT